VNRSLAVATSTLASLTRLGNGRRVGSPGRRPEQPLELYEFEACPFCRKVREALSILDLEVIVYPCPKNGPRYRPAVVARGGKAQFPYLVDPNLEVELYESDDIVAHLFREYGNGEVPALLAPGLQTTLGVALAGLWRAGAGGFYRASHPPEQLLELYAYEPSPFSRLVRETLCSLELPYRLRNMAHGSARRAAFEAEMGRLQFPYLVDPNAGVELFESADIVRHLEESYAA
jgi:glutathione S-transferase